MPGDHGRPRFQLGPPLLGIAIEQLAATYPNVLVQGI
jgi:hypothetical protein